MTPRERVLTALNHEEPDRVPLFLGTSGVTTLLGTGYERLKTHLGIQGGPSPWFSKPLQYAWMDEEVLQRLGFDGRPVMAGPAPSRLAGEISDTELVDAWGCRWQSREGVHYFEVTNSPLHNATIDDLDRYVAAAVHCIQPDVPSENVVAMCEAVRVFGKYPIE